MKGFAGTIKFKAPGDHRDHGLLVVGSGQVLGLDSGGDRLPEKAVLGIGRRQGIEETGVGMTGGLNGPEGEMDSLRPIAEVGVGVGGQNPGQAVEGLSVVRLQGDGGTELLGGLA